MNKPLEYCFFEVMRTEYLPVLASVSVVSTLRTEDDVDAYVRLYCADVAVSYGT